MSSPTPSRAMGPATSTSSKPPFQPDWKDSDADAFSILRVAAQKAPRAWERQAQSPFNRNKGYRKVWRRYNLRKRGDAPEPMDDGRHFTDSASDSECMAHRTAARVVKKRRAGSIGPDVSPRKRVQSKATKWDRRKSGLPRKQAPLLEMNYAHSLPTAESISPPPQSTTESSSTDEDLKGQPPKSPNAEELEDLTSISKSKDCEDELLDKAIDSPTTSHASTQPDVNERVDDAHAVMDTVELDQPISSEDLVAATTLDAMEGVASVSEAGEKLHANADVAEIESTLENQSLPPSPTDAPAYACSPVARPECGVEDAAPHDTCEAANRPELKEATRKHDNESRQTSVGEKVDVLGALENAADTRSDLRMDGAECPSQAGAEYAAGSSEAEDLLLFSPAGRKDPCPLENDEKATQELADAQHDSDKANLTPFEGPSETTGCLSVPEDKSSSVASAILIKIEGPEDAESVGQATISVPVVENDSPETDTDAVANERENAAVVSCQQPPSLVNLANSATAPKRADESMTDPTVDIGSSYRQRAAGHSVPSLPLETSQFGSVASIEQSEPSSPSLGHNEEGSTALMRTTDSEEDDDMSDDGDAPGFDDIADTIKLNLSTLAERSIDTVGGTIEDWDCDTDEKAHESELMGNPHASANTEDVANHLDADTAHLMQFLNRAAASKQEGPTVIARRSSLQNRRDSDAVRHALASPRKPLEDKDVNSPMTRRCEDEEFAQLKESMSSSLKAVPATAQLSDAELPESESSPRRSTRSRRRPSGVPPGFGVTESSALGPNRITMRRADGANPVVLERDPSIRLAYLTRQNTKKNKGSAILAPARLLKLTAEMQMGDAGDTSPHSIDSREGARNGAERNVRWDEQLVYFFNEATTAPIDIAHKVSTATPVPVTSRATEESKLAKAATKAKRQRGLGAANGTPAKGLLATATYLPMEVQAEHSEGAKTRTSKARPVSKLLTPSITTTARNGALTSHVSKLVPPSARTSTAEPQIKLAAPKAAKLPRPKQSIAGGLAQWTASIAKDTSLSTPKKSAGIPTPRKSSVPKKFG